MIWFCNLNEQSTLIYVNLLRRGGVFLQISGKFSECVLHASIHAKYWLHTLACDFLNSGWIAKLNLDRDMRTVKECQTSESYIFQSKNIYFPTNDLLLGFQLKLKCVLLVPWFFFFYLCFKMIFCVKSAYKRLKWELNVTLRPFDISSSTEFTKSGRGQSLTQLYTLLLHQKRKIQWASEVSEYLKHVALCNRSVTTYVL